MNKYILIVLFILIASIVFAFTGGVRGVTTLFSDYYLPKTYLILEKYPVRLVLYGNMDGLVLNDDPKEHKDTIAYRSLRTNNLIKIIEALNRVHTEKGKFDYNINVNFDSNLNSSSMMTSGKSISYPNIKH